MNKDQIREKINSIVADQTDNDVSIITPETNLASDLLADSLDLIEIVMSLEEEFSIDFFEISRDYEDTVTTVGDLHKGVLQLMNLPE